MEFVDEDDKSLVELLIAQGSEKKSVDEDCKSLLEQLNAEEKQLRNKRRWLLGLTTFEDEEAGDGGEDTDTDEDVKTTSNAQFKRRHPIPESLLREDDVSYELIKSSLEKGLIICNKYHISEDEMQLLHLPRDARGVLHLIKDMTNQGLDRFLQALTNASLDFAKTRWKMTQTIKQHLLSSSLNKRQKLQLSENQLAVLRNPHNYRWSSQCRFLPADSDSYRAAVYKILGALEALPTQTLVAMHRKIKGIKHYMPRLIPVKKSGWGRDALIQRLRKKSLKLLSKLNEGDSLPEPLAKAMDVAGLSFKLIQGCEFATNFVIQPSPETNALQNEIAKCLKLLDERMELRVLKDIQQALNAAGEKIADRSLRTLVRNVLTEFLCECGDMEIVPECLRHVLAIIKKSCKAPVPHPEKMNIEQDVESILSVSASMKQLVWGVIPSSEDEKLDREFADAYVEDLEDSYEDDVEGDDDDDDDDDDDEEVNISSASTGNSKCHFSQRMHLMRHHLVRVKIPQQEGHTVASDDRRSRCKNNQYLAVQAATDEASVVAYRLIDHILNEYYAQIQEGSEQLDSGAEEGNSKRKKRKATQEEDPEEEDGDDGLVVKAVEELIPWFAKKCEGLKKLK